MSFSFQVAGHAGTGMSNNDEVEGEAVKAFIGDVLESARTRNLNLSVQDVSPGHWAPERLNTLATT